MLGQWVRACSADQLAEGCLESFVHGGRKILLSNLRGKIRATGLICTHADADLSAGFLSEEGVRCPLHLSVFDLDDGKPQNPPAEEALEVYNVKIEQDGVYVEV